MCNRLTQSVSLFYNLRATITRIFILRLAHCIFVLIFTCLQFIITISYNYLRRLDNCVIRRWKYTALQFMIFPCTSYLRYLLLFTLITMAFLIVIPYFIRANNLCINQIVNDLLCCTLCLSTMWVKRARTISSTRAKCRQDVIKVITLSNTL